MARNETRILGRDPMPLIVLVAMPLIGASLFSRAFRAALVLSGYPHASGADYAVPAQIAEFGFFLVPYTGYLFFREHQWKTSARLRVSSATTADAVIGKAAPMVLIGLLQVAVLLAVGAGVMDLHLRDPMALVAVSVLYICCAVAIGAALTAVLRTLQQLNAVGFLGATVMGAIGGALVPLAALPGWTRSISAATPQYWLMRASHDILLDHRSASAIVLPLTVLSAVLAGSVLLAVRLLRLDVEKIC